jgi:orotidine-5'-phosphate decarboxylase
MNTTALFNAIRNKKSFLCVGLDTDIDKLPHSILECDDPVFEFNKAIVDATAPYAVAFKPNIAFYESLGVEGWESLELTANYIKSKYPDIFLIADAKRGDIGNTSKMYARSFFKNMNFDAITVAPYMGEDSVTPFLEYEGKTVIILALTSNKGANDFQLLREETGKKMLFEKVLETTSRWGNTNNIMYVVGATKAEHLKEIRKIVPDHFLLIPGVGAQGGSLEDVAQFGMNKQCGLIVNSSREIIYADATEKFAKVSGERAMQLQQKMESLLKQFHLL